MLFKTKESQIGTEGTYYVNKTEESSTYFIPFVPGFNNSGFLDNKTISANATRSGYTTTQLFYTEYYTHNANGLLAARTLKDVIENQAKTLLPDLDRRSFVLVDRSWAGAGASSAATITNLERTYDNMKSTISMAMGLSMYGFSNIMVDACGTKGDFDE